MAESEVKIEATTYGVKISQLQTLGEALKDPSALMKQVGVLLLIQAQRSFENQGLGDIRWKPRYPNQKPPVINIAGSLQDLNKGTTPKAHRFQRRPALMDTKALYMSVARDASGANRLMGTHVVQVGSVLPYAGTMQWGGKSTQPVTDTAKKALSKWMKSLRGSRRKIASYDRSKREWVPKDGRQPKSVKQKSNEIDRADKLGFLFGKDKLTTKVWPRPFLGITTQVDKDIQELVQNWVATYVSR